MAKRKKTITAGRIVKTILYTAPEPRDGERAKLEKSRATTAAQRAMNDKTAKAKLEMLMAANFEEEDWFLTLTYRPSDLPSNRAEAAGNLRKFLRNLRAFRKRHTVPLKYIYTTEEKHGAARLHHHLVINATAKDIETIRSLWPYGDVVEVERIRDRDYDVLAQYMTKESVDGRPVGAQMWTGSRNLLKPKVETWFVPDDTALSVPYGCHILEKEEKATGYGYYSFIKYRTDKPAKPRRSARRNENLNIDPAQF